MTRLVVSAWGEFSPGSVTAMPLFLILFCVLLLGMGLTGFGATREAEGGSRATKYFPIGIYAIVAFWGWPFFAYAQDDITKMSRLVGGSSTYAYNGVFLIPILAALLTIGFGFYWDKFRRNDEAY